MEARSVEELDAAPEESGVVVADFELTAVIWQVRDDINTAAQTAAEPELDEHIVAHIKVGRL